MIDLTKEAILDFIVNNYNELSPFGVIDHLQTEFGLSIKQTNTILTRYEELPMLTRELMRTNNLKDILFIGV